MESQCQEGSKLIDSFNTLQNKNQNNITTCPAHPCVWPIPKYRNTTALFWSGFCPPQQLFELATFQICFISFTWKRIFYIYFWQPYLSVMTWNNIKPKPNPSPMILINGNLCISAFCMYPNNRVFFNQQAVRILLTLGDRSESLYWDCVIFMIYNRALVQVLIPQSRTSTHWHSHGLKQVLGVTVDELEYIHNTAGGKVLQF